MWQVGKKYELWHLWCLEHPTFYDESKYGRCPICGYQTNEMKLEGLDISKGLTAPDAHQLFELPPDRHPLSQRFHVILEELASLHDKKQQDYGRTADPFANVRGSIDFGVKPWVGAMIRANDKIRRIQKAASGGTLANESIVDSFNDLAVYAVIARVLWEEEHESNPDV